MDVTDFTVANLTPPGYFNLGPNALQSTKDYVQWWNNILSDMAGDSVNLKTMLLTPWLYEYHDSYTPNLSVAYPLVSNALDISGNGKNGTAKNVTWTGGVANFNGVSSKIQLVSPVTNLSGHSISFWFKRNGLPSVYERIFSNYIDKNNHTEIYISSSTGRVVFFNRISSVASGGIYTALNLCDNVWHHVVLNIIDSTNVQWIIDKVPESIQTLTVPISALTSPTLYLGSSSASDYFTGELSKFYIFNRALTDEERTWLYEDYPVNAPIVPWLQYLLNMYGMGFFLGTNSQAAYLYRLVSSAWSTSTIFNITMILQTLSLPPFSWFTANTPLITAGNLVTSVMDTGFIIYSTAGNSPATPAPSDYSPRNWDVPAGWANSAASATYYCRGYISGLTVVWSAPRPVSDFENAYVFSAAVPVAVPPAGTVVIVQDDSTGDIGPIYYSDGSAWRKNSIPNADLGLVNPLPGIRPDPEAITVWAPDPSTISYAIDSAIPPQSDGPTEGYGTFATWANTAVFNDQISISVTQIAGGTVALAVLFELLRRIKPVNKTFSIDISGTQYTITDMRQK